MVDEYFKQNRIRQSSKHLLHVIKKENLDLIDDHKLIKIMEDIDKASDLINDYLTIKKKNLN